MICLRCNAEITGKIYWQMRAGLHMCDPCHRIRYPAEGDPVSEKKETVNHPQHYNMGSIEVIAVIEDWQLGFNDGNVIKYIGRARHKGKLIEDAEKGRWYADRFVQEYGGASWNPGDTPHRMQQQVLEFIEATGHARSHSPGTWRDEKSKKLSVELIREEFAELMEAIENDDWPEIIDGGVDLLYVIYYMFNVIGIDVRPFADEVQRANMDKQNGPRDPETGKQLKPAGWKPPNIAGMLAKLRNGGIL